MTEIISNSLKQNISNFMGNYFQTLFFAFVTKHGHTTLPQSPPQVLCKSGWAYINLYPRTSSFVNNAKVSFIKKFGSY